MIALDKILFDPILEKWMVFENNIPICPFCAQNLQDYNFRINPLYKSLSCPNSSSKCRSVSFSNRYKEQKINMALFSLYKHNNSNIKVRINCIKNMLYVLDYNLPFGNDIIFSITIPEWSIFDIPTLMRKTQIHLTFS